MIKQDRRMGLSPLLIVASAGSAKTGSVDDLEGVSGTAEAERCWLHVDGASWGGVMLSGSWRQFLSGLRRADSFSVGGFEWLGQMDGRGVLLVREKRHLLQSCFVEAEDAVHDEMPDSRNYSLESTGSEGGVKLWFTLRVLGLHTVESMIHQGIGLAERGEVEIINLPF